ncbi:MAG: alginate export family protein [Candidatus Omnitrophica bacterium]|nr:alginate export family protein [Candidatus Omnitrophota bacterium]MBU1869173.1 alginate export family protein [Candidatus Omnitrophota bacterium]
MNNKRVLVSVATTIFLLLSGFCNFYSVVLAETKFTWGPYFRIRHEYWKNWKDMNNDLLDNRNFFRVKSSLWGNLDLNKDINFYGKLTNEFRAYTYFGGSTPSVPDKSPTKKGYRFEIDEIVFDNLYFNIKNIAGQPLDLCLGRQDLRGFGEGFLLADGTPQDGSRTYYFNASKTTLRVDPNNSVDMIYINDPRDERFLPVINRKELAAYNKPASDKIPQLLNTTDEEAYSLYWKYAGNPSYDMKGTRQLALEMYYIYKIESGDNGSGYQASKGRINTFGSFAKYAFGSWALKGQLASQFGNYGDNDRQGLGGYAYLEKNFYNSAWKPELKAGYIYLSGDKKKTDKVESWDPLFSRYPWISELYMLSMSAETGISGYWTNLQVWRTELSFKPSKKTKITLWYNFLRANEQVAASSIFSGTGKNRGHLPQLKAEYSFSDNISTYFLAEYLIPGDFYKNKSEALFLRSELQFKF